MQQVTSSNESQAMQQKKKKEYEPIPYSVGLMTDTIKKRKLPCATIVERGTLDLEFIADEIAKSTTVTKTDVIAVLTGVVEFGMEHLASGYRISFGDLGQFFPSLKARCVNSLDECDESTIKRVCCHFRPSLKLSKMLNKVSFERTLSAGERKRAVRTNDNEIQEELDNQE